MAPLVPKSGPELDPIILIDYVPEYLFPLTSSYIIERSSQLFGAL